MAAGTQFFTRQQGLINSNVNAQRELDQAYKTLVRSIEEHYAPGEQSNEELKYEPNPKDPMDVRFADIFNANAQIKKFKCRKIKFDLSSPTDQDEFEVEEQMADMPADCIPMSEYRHYCVGGLRMIFENYGGNNTYYMLFRPAGLDTTSYGNFFDRLLKYLKPKIFWRLKPKQQIAEPDENQIQEIVEQPVEQE